jgi:YgiT-type zinc finger domain-containing protein
MKCVICKQAGTQEGVTTVTFERGDSVFVVKEVPAQICPNCGEDYVDEKVVADLLRSADDLALAGAKIDVRTYRSAA